MADRIPEMVWQRTTEKNSDYHITITRLEALGRRLLWIVYKSGDDEWRMGVGLPQEDGLHVVIGTAATERTAKLDVRDVAHRLGHTW
jgi:hypothetical protein